MAENRLEGQALQAALEDIYTENATTLLTDFDPEDPDPIGSLQKARRAGFRIVGQSMIEPVLVEALWSLRAHMRFQAQGIENPWAKIVAEGITDADVDTFKEDSYAFHEKFNVENVPTEAIEGASPMVVNHVLPDLAHNLILQLLRGNDGQPLRENAIGIVSTADAPQAHQNATEEIERRLREQPGQAEFLHGLLEAANRQVISDMRVRVPRTGFTRQLISLSRTQRLDKTEIRLGYQTAYAKAVNPVLEELAHNYPGISEHQRKIFAPLTRIIRTQPPGEQPPARR